MSSMSVDPSVSLCQRKRNFLAAQWRILQKKKFISVDDQLKEKKLISADDIYLKKKKFISVDDLSQKEKKRKFTPDDGIHEVTNEVEKFIWVDGLDKAMESVTSKLLNLEKVQGRMVTELEMMAKRVEDEFSQMKMEVKEKINMPLDDCAVMVGEKLFGMEENGRKEMLKVGTMIMQNTRSIIEEVVTAMNEKISKIANDSNEKFKAMNEHISANERCNVQQIIDEKLKIIKRDVREEVLGRLDQNLCILSRTVDEKLRCVSRMIDERFEWMAEYG